MEQFKADFTLNFIAEDRWLMLLKGLLTTLEITAVALIIGVVIGTLVAAVRSTYDKNKDDMKRRGGASYAVLTFLNLICRIYLAVIRGTPTVVQLMISYYIIFAFSTNSVGVVMLAFGINSGAYVAEIIRGGIMSIDEGQFEAAKSLGINYHVMMKSIILPQALKNVLPAIGNEFIALLKETSIAGYIGLQDLTRGGDIIRSLTYEPYLPLLTVAVVYLILVVLLTSLVSWLERRLKKNEK